MPGPQAPRVAMEGRGEIIILSSNNYLGLSAEPEIMAAGKAALDRFGAGTASVRFICGTFTVHRALEQASCAYKDGCMYMDYETALTHINCDVDFDEVDEEGATCTETAPVFKRGVDRAESANDLDALRIAAESEAAAVEYYREAAETAPSEDAKRFFQHLVGIESGHQKMLDAEYDYYAANGFYFDVREFSLEM